MNNDIKTNLGIIQESIQWADKYGKDSFPREVFKDYRRQLKKISDALSENCSAAAYGESQVGKSYLMSSLLSSPDTPFVIKNKDKEYNFIDQINPSGGNNTKQESTGVITRFTIRKSDAHLADFVKVKNLSVVDIILLLTDSYYNDVKINTDSVLQIDDINEALSDLSHIWESKATTQACIGEDDIRDIHDYLHDIIGNSTAAICKSNFKKVVAPVIQYVPYNQWVDVFSLLWNRNPEYNRLFTALINEYSKIGFATDVYVPFDAVLRDKGTLLKIEWLDAVCGISHELEKGEEAYTDIYDTSGNKIAADFSKGYLSALIGELTFVLPESIAKERRFLKKIDLLDFPGARSRERIKEEELKTVLPIVLRRGKVAYLFNKYSRSLKISAVLFCHHNDQKTEPTLGSTIESWIGDNIGETPEQRVDMLKRTNGIAPLFMICTKFNIDLERTKNDADASKLDSHWARFKTIIPEMIKEKWLDNWLPAGVFGSRYFQNLYLLRDFYWSAKNQVFDGYNDKTGSPETALHSFDDYPSYFDDLKASFLANSFVKNHFAKPEQSWNDVATVNNDGSRAIIRNLDAIAEVLDDARRTTYLTKLIKIKEEILRSLNVYYESDDKEENNIRVRTITGDIKLRTEISFGENPELFGRIIDGMMVSPAALREIAYDILTRHIDVPKTVSAIKMVRASCGISASDSREVKIEKLSKRYNKDEAGLKAAFNEEGLSLEDIISDNSELLATVPDVIAKHIIEFWNNNINQQVKFLDEFLPHADEIAFMLLSLLERLGVKKEISNKINKYSDIFDDKSLPNAIADYAALTLNNFVSTIGRDYMTEEDLKLVEEKSKACHLSVDVLPSGSAPSAEPQPLLDVLIALDESRDLINRESIDMDTLRKLPFWDNYQRWENFITIGLLYTSDISHVDPLANAAIKGIIDNCSSLYQSN